MAHTGSRRSGAAAVERSHSPNHPHFDENTKNPGPSKKGVTGKKGRIEALLQNREFPGPIFNFFGGSGVMWWGYTG